jgi:Uma2 family endonuclease
MAMHAFPHFSGKFEHATIGARCALGREEPMLNSSIMHSAREGYHRGLHHSVSRLPRSWRDWELPEETMPESPDHAKAITLIEAILAWWARSQPSTQVERNIGIRWMKSRPSVGLDPDVSVFRPALPNNTRVSSVLTWEPGYTVPILAIEVVSETNSRKDYEVVPKKCENAGIPELCVFDPHLAGPRGEDGLGPHRLQLWSRNEKGQFKQVYVGDGPVYSPTLHGYFIAVDEGQKLRISSDEAGLQWWLTSEEVERAEKVGERKAKEAERKAKETALVAKEAARKAEKEARADEAAERAAKEKALIAEEAARKAEKEALALVAELKAQLAEATKKK